MGNVLSPFSSEFWDAAGEELGDAKNYKRAGAEMMAIVTIDTDHLSKEFKGDVDGALADLDNYSVEDFGIDLAIVAASFVGGAVVAKAGGVATRAAMKTAGGKAFARGIANVGAKAAQGATNARAVMAMMAGGEIKGVESKAFSKKLYDFFKGANKDGYVMVGGEKVELAPEIKTYGTRMTKSYEAGLEVSEEEAQRLMGASVKRMQMDMKPVVNTELEAALARSAEASAVKASGRTELEELAEKTLSMLDDVEGKQFTDLELKNAQIDDLLQRYAGGEDVFADLQEAYIKRAGLTPEQVASRQATASAEMNKMSALESDAFNSTYGNNLNVGKGGMHKRMMTHLAVMGVSGSAIRMIMQRAIGVKDDSQGAPSMNVQPIGEVVGEEVAKTAGKIAGAQAGAAAVGTELTGSGSQVVGETAVNIAAGAGVPGAAEAAAVVDVVKAVQTAETIGGIETLAGAAAVGAVGAGAAAGATVASALYEILANEFSTPVEHQHVDQLHEIARTHHSSVHGYVEGDTTASVLSRDHILELVHKSQKVYDADQPDSVQVFDEAGTDFRAVLYANNDHDILSFRGTGSLTNAITDLNFVSAKLSEHFEGVSPEADLSCHQGFLQMLKTQYDPIVEALSARMDRPLRVTGHSMGAGLGCVFSYLYGVKNPDASQPTETITFGSPRVFTTGSRMTYNARVENCFTVITDRDPITQLPPVALGYEHIGKVITLFENPGILFRPTQKSDDRRLKSAQVNVARFNYYAGFADVEYRATMKALTTDQQTFQYCKDTVLDEFDTHRESVPDATYTAIQNATMPDKSVFAQVINGNVNLQFNRPSTYFIQGLETSAHTLTCYERRVQKLPQQLLDIDLKDDEDEDEDEDGDVAVEDDDDGFRGVHEFNGAEPAHTEGMHSDHHSQPTVDYHEAVARERKQSVEQPTDPFHSRLQEHVNDPNSYVLGYVVYPEGEAGMYENAVVGFV